MKFCKVRDVKTPTRGTPLSAGIDFFVPNDFPGEHYLIPGDAVNIPSGIWVKVPHGYMLVFKNKSGVAVKKDLQVGACVVDEDYQGEIHLHVRNIGMNLQTIKPGEKLVQAVLVPVLYEDMEEVLDATELYDEATERGEGGFGSTGTE